MNSGTFMRKIATAALVAVLVLAGSIVAAGAADDASPVVGSLPDTAGNLKVYLFNLKKNGIALDMSPDEFCKKMDYGDAVFGDRPDEIDKDNKVGPGKLNWVICRYKGK